MAPSAWPAHLSRYSATNKFYINNATYTDLDRTEATPEGWGYYVFGVVIEGMNVMGRISKVRTGTRGRFYADAPLYPV